MKKFGGQGKKKQKCINRVCTEMTAKAKGMVRTLYSTLMAFHYQTFIANQPQKEMKQELTENLQARGATPAGSQPPQIKQGNLTGDTRKTFITTAKSSPAKFLPLQTTPELYTTLTEIFIDKPLVYNPQEGMVFDPPHLQNTHPT
jgi:hypothetical protein